MRQHHIPSRLHLQGDTAPTRLRPSARDRRMEPVFSWSVGSGTSCKWSFASRGDPLEYRACSGRASWWSSGYLCCSTVASCSTSCGIRRLFGWVRVSDPTTFGRWRRAQPGRLRTWIFRLPAKLIPVCGQAVRPDRLSQARSTSAARGASPDREAAPGRASRGAPYGSADRLCHPRAAMESRVCHPTGIWPASRGGAETAGGRWPIRADLLAADIPGSLRCLPRVASVSFGAQVRDHTLKVRCTGLGRSVAVHASRALRNGLIVDGRVQDF